MWKSLPFHEKIGNPSRMHLLWVFSIPDHGIFSTMEEIKDMLKSDSNGKEETYSESDLDDKTQQKMELSPNSFHMSKLE